MYSAFVNKMLQLTISSSENTVQTFCQLIQAALISDCIGKTEFLKSHRTYNTEKSHWTKRLQTRCSYIVTFMNSFIELIVSSFCPSARCWHAASRHNRQVGLSSAFLMEATRFILTGGVVRVVCGCIQSCLSLCRYSGSGSSGAASMRKVGGQTAWKTLLFVSNPLLMKRYRLQLYQSPATPIHCYMEINCPNDSSANG